MAGRLAGQAESGLAEWPTAPLAALPDRVTPWQANVKQLILKQLFWFKHQVRTDTASGMERKNEVRRLQQQLRRRKKPLALSTSTHDIGVMILSYSLGAEDCLRAYLAREWEKKSKRRREKDPDGPLEPLAQPEAFAATSWLEIIRERFRAWSLDDEVALITGSWPSPCRVQRAKEMVGSFRLRSWVSEQNQKGVAPSGPAVWRQHCLLHRRDESGTISAWRSKSKSQRRSAQNWLQRWRLSEQILKGQFKAGPALSEAVVRSKAKHGCAIAVAAEFSMVLGKTSFSAMVFATPWVDLKISRQLFFFALETCPENGHPIDDHLYLWHQKLRPENGRDFRPAFGTILQRFDLHF